MKRFLKAAAWLWAIALIALSPFLSALLPASRQELVQRSYASWCGVLRIWKCEGWPCGSGSLTAWLNECVAAFEKQYPGVYIQISDVSPEAMQRFSYGDAVPPDAILFPPGLFETPDALSVFDDSPPLRPNLIASGTYSGRLYAVPVCMGGYAMALNHRLLAQTPGNWSLVAGNEQPLLDCPEDSRFLSWSSAILALFAGGSAPDALSLPGDGIDLGLPDSAPANTCAPVPEKQAVNALPQSLPDDFRTESSVFSRFTGGQVAAIPVTQREIARLNSLSETGKAPDWRVEAMGVPFTDQILYYSVVDADRSDAAARQSLCRDFLACLLSEKTQRSLRMAQAFPVRSDTVIYSAPGFHEMELSLLSDQLSIPPAFGSEWRKEAASLADALQPSGSTEPSLRALRRLLNGNL